MEYLRNGVKGGVDHEIDALLGLRTRQLTQCFAEQGSQALFPGKAHRNRRRVPYRRGRIERSQLRHHPHKVEPGLLVDHVIDNGHDQAAGRRLCSWPRSLPCPRNVLGAQLADSAGVPVDDGL